MTQRNTVAMMSTDYVHIDIVKENGVYHVQHTDGTGAGSEQASSMNDALIIASRIMTANNPENTKVYASVINRETKSLH
jgi:hypothetical protein